MLKRNLSVFRVFSIVFMLGNILWSQEYIRTDEYSGNPLFDHIFTADPSALAYRDTLYIFTGHDEQAEGAEGYRMYDWHVFSSSDLIDWTDHGAVLSLDDFDWAVSNAWAGDCVERDGKFYWYVPMSHADIPGYSIGVAVSDHPAGPYHDAKGSAIITNDMTTDAGISWDDIDPDIFIDDDGQAYLYWGNTSCKYVKLKDNMIDMEGDIQYVSLPYFTEGPWLHKREGLYYLTYAAGWPETIDYAISESPEGPWSHKGMLNDQVENSGTNHPAIVEFKNQWYFIYHNGALPTGGDYRRSVCIDTLGYNQDGTLKQIIQTDRGVRRVVDCESVSITPYVRVNSGTWVQDSSVEVTADDTVTLGPQPVETGSWTWTRCGTSGASREQVIFPETSCTATAVYTNECGMESSQEFNINLITGIKEEVVNNIKNKVFISPDPLRQGRFFVKLPESSNRAEIKIFNSQGKRVYVTTIRGDDRVKINSGLESGVYFVKIRTEESYFMENLIIVD